MPEADSFLYGNCGAHLFLSILNPACNKCYITLSNILEILLSEHKDLVSFIFLHYQ